MADTDGEITRIVRIVLDEQAAKKAEEGAKKTAAKIDLSLSSIKDAAKKVGVALAAALGAVVAFGAKAVAEAVQANKEWSSLGSTVRAVGGDFDALRPSVEAAAAAFSDATIHGQGEYVQSLDRMIALTGDVEASMANMGLVANVAARFFGGDLAAATDTVARAMTGNVRALRQLGIETEDAQTALNMLASRSMGAATAAADTFAGTTLRLRNKWNDFMGLIGDALVAGESGGALGLLMDWLEAMHGWVEANAGAITRFATGAMRLFVDVVDGAYRGIRGLAEILSGVLVFALGMPLRPLAVLARGMANMLTMFQGWAQWATRLGVPGAKALADGLGTVASAAEQAAVQLERATEAGLDLIRTGATRIATPTARPLSGRDTGAGPLAGNEAAPRIAEATQATETATAAAEAHTAALEKEAIAMSALEEHAGDLAGAMMAAAEGQLGAFARNKAKQLALESLEHGIRAIGSILMGNPAGAAANTMLAEKFAGLAAMWGAVGAVAGGGPSRGSVFGAGMTSARQTTQSASSQGQGADVKIYLVGDGFDALNPRVQAVVRGAQEQATERYGNARVRVLTAN